MKDKQAKKIREQKETPITDGDTRPDGQEIANHSNNSSPLTTKKKTGLTKERAADINSLEDYKDAQ